MKQSKKACVAMLLAGGQGSRLGVLTAHNAKPAIPFGGKYRVIDFPLSNCMNSGIDTVGVLTQYRPLTLNAYIGNGQPWDLDRMRGGVTILPPYLDGENADWYCGTADAIYQNLAFLDRYDPDEVLILSGDHVYLMDYAEMLAFHRSVKADCTVASIEVPFEDASRYGILQANEDGRIVNFVEKPKNPPCNTASMGIYVFDYQILKRELIRDAADRSSDGDFGKNILPFMLQNGAKLYTYRFGGYFRDVGTPESYFEANMDLVAERPLLNLQDSRRRICSRTTPSPPHRIGMHGQVRDSVVTEGCLIDGTVERGVLSSRVSIGKGAVVRDAVLMEGVTVGECAHVENCIIDSGVEIGAGCFIGKPRAEGARLTMIGASVKIPKGTRIEDGTVIDRDVRREGGD